MQHNAMHGEKLAKIIWLGTLEILNHLLAMFQTPHIDGAPHDAQ